MWEATSCQGKQVTQVGEVTVYMCFKYNKENLSSIRRDTVDQETRRQAETRGEIMDNLRKVVCIVCALLLNATGRKNWF